MHLDLVGAILNLLYNYYVILKLQNNLKLNSKLLK